MGKVYLLPLPISETEKSDWIGMSYKVVLEDTKLFFVENVRTARRFIASLKLGIDIDQLRFELLDKTTTQSEIRDLIFLIKQTGSVGIMSESGCPGIADPGSVLIDNAHMEGFEIIPIVGPSSILLALMSSGLSGQCFSFNGYLPIQKKDRELQIRALEIESKKRNQAQIFIETPYRNAVLWESLLEILSKDTKLAYGFDLLGSSQKIMQRPVKEWRILPPIKWEKSPTIFLFQA